MNNDNNIFVIKINKLCAVLFGLCIIANNVLGSDAKLYFVSKVCLAAFCGFTALYLWSNRYIFATKRIIPLICFMVLTIVSCIWAPYQNIAEKQLITQVQLYVLFFCSYFFMNMYFCVETFIKSTFISGILLTLYAVYKYGLSGYITLMNSGERMGGMIANENVFGIVFAQAAIVTIVYIIRTKKTYHKFFLILYLIVMVCFTFSSGSKKATLMIVLGLLIICFMKYGLKRIYKTVIFSVVTIMSLYKVLQLSMFSTINIRLMEFLTGEANISDRIRADMISRGWELICDRPFLGTGLQSFSQLSGFDVYSHNNFIEVAVSTGIIGFVMFYSVYIIFFYEVFRKYKSIRHNDSMIVLVTLAALYLIFSYGMVEMYEKTCWILFAVMLSSVDNNFGIESGNGIVNLERNGRGLPQNDYEHFSENS